MQKIDINLYDFFHDKNLFLPTRTIYFGGQIEDDEITPKSVSQLIKNLHILEHKEIAPISLILMTCGGYWESGIAVYDIIKSLKSKVNILGLGEVYSMGSIILQAGYNRCLTKHTKLMLHDPSNSYSGSSKAFENWAKDSKLTRKQMYDIFYQKIKEKNKNITRKKIEKICSHDSVYSSNQAVKLGLADSILGDINK